MNTAREAINGAYSNIAVVDYSNAIFAIGIYAVGIAIYRAVGNNLVTIGNRHGVFAFCVNAGGRAILAAYSNGVAR